MAELTNKKGLPQPLVDAIQYDTYKIKGDIGVTTLIDAPQIRILKMRHSKEIVTDVTEMLWAMLGTAVHHILERAHIKDKRKQAFFTVIETIKEESGKFTDEDKEKLQQLVNSLIKLMAIIFPETAGRYIWETSLHYEYNGVLLYGTLDIYDKWEKCLYDYKVCSVYAYMYPESRRKWSAQTNIYAFLLREKGYQVDLINIVAIFRDWSKSRAEIKPDYPSEQFMTIPIAVVDQEKMRRYIEKRIDMHKAAENGDVPQCSGEDMWSSATEFIVKTPHVRKYIRKFDDEDRCDEFIRINASSYEFGLKKMIKPGEAKRCQSYCPVKDFCPQKAAADKLHEEYLKQNK